MLWQKRRNAKTSKIKFQQRVVKLKLLISKRTMLLQFFTTSLTTKSFYWNVMSQFYYYSYYLNCLDKHVFDNVNRIKHSSPMNNTVINKIKHFSQLFDLHQQIALKQNWYYFLSWSIITTKLNMHTYNICKSLLEAISMATISTWLNFLLEINQYLYQALMP